VTHLTPAPVTFSVALRFWIKLGFISFGGPAGQIAVMHRELVDERRWISDKRFAHALNYCMLLPGPEAQQLATYIGWLMHRTAGGVAAGVLFLLPSVAILIVLSWVYIAFGAVPVVAGFFYGVKPAVTTIVVQAVLRIGSRTLTTPVLWVIAFNSFAAIFIWDVPFPVIVAVAIIAGSLIGKVAPGTLRPAAVHHSRRSIEAPAVIDDDTPPPSHALFRWRRFLGVIGIGLALWALPMAALAATFGSQHTLTHMGWFFTKAALMTFGGAYAVLPYVYQGAVNHFSWLTATQMIDGLALGETTPGPLIMVVAFVGFVGAYTRLIFGPEWPFLAGATAALVVTWFTFLPSFIFIFAGGPVIERTHNEVRFTAPLVAITAAVVGVILNLAVFFAYHVLWPRGFAGPFDWISAAIGSVAATALIGYKQHVIPVIIACGIAGLIVYTFSDMAPITAG
jgi:chromate transporter